MNFKKNVIILLLLFPLLMLHLYAQKRKITGTVEGKITAPISNDWGNKGTINRIGLAGIQVNLHYKKGGLYYLLGTTCTDENGNYKISYNKNENRNAIQLYLKTLAKTNNSYNIVSKKNGIVQKQSLYIGSHHENGETITNQNIHINDAVKGSAFRSVHWARKGMKYFADQLVPLKRGLILKINKRGSYSNNYLYCKYPVIHLKRSSANHENTIYHEFGHYVMYRLQNNHIKIPYGERGVNNHKKRDENTSLLSWLEGWACAIQMILDAAHWQEDNEYGWDATGYTAENVEKFNSINNGFRSEYHIATAIYDLWDGPDKNLPQQIPYLNIHGWNDSITTKVLNRAFYPWKTIDDVEFTLAQICAPLQTIKKRKDLKNLRNVGDYYNILLSQLPDCKDRADVSRVFRENRVLWNIKDYENEQYTGNLSSDQFFTVKSKKERGFLRMEFPLIFSKWKDHYKVNIPIRDGEKKYHLYALPNSSLAIIDDYWIGTYDVSRKIDERIEFYLNPKSNPEKTNLIRAHFYTCGKNQILVRNGNLELGMLNTGYTADLTVNDGSLLQIDEHGTLTLNHNTTLRITQGGTLYVKNLGSIVFKGNGSIIVEAGAYLCVDEGAIIKHESVNSKFEIDENAIQGVNPELNISCDVTLF